MHKPYCFTLVLQIFSEALYTTLRKVLKDIASPEIAFAWRAFMFDATTKNILSVTAGSRPGRVWVYIYLLTVKRPYPMTTKCTSIYFLRKKPADTSPKMYIIPLHVFDSYLHISNVFCTTMWQSTVSFIVHFFG